MERTEAREQLPPSPVDEPSAAVAFVNLIDEGPYGFVSKRNGVVRGGVSLVQLLFSSTSVLRL